MHTGRRDQQKRTPEPARWSCEPRPSTCRSILAATGLEIEVGRSRRRKLGVPERPRSSMSLDLRCPARGGERPCGGSADRDADPVDQHIPSHRRRQAGNKHEPRNAPARGRTNFDGRRIRGRRSDRRAPEVTGEDADATDVVPGRRRGQEELCDRRLDSTLIGGGLDGRRGRSTAVDLDTGGMRPTIGTTECGTGVPDLNKSAASRRRRAIRRTVDAGRCQTAARRRRARP